MYSSWTSTIVKVTDKYSSIWIGHKICMDERWPFLCSVFIKPAMSRFHWELGSLHTAFLCIKLCAILCIELSLHTWDGVAVALNNVTTSLRHLCNRILDRNFQKWFQKWFDRVQVLYTYVCQMKSEYRESIFSSCFKNPSFKSCVPASEKAWRCLHSLWTIYASLAEIQRENLDAWLILLINGLERICK